MKNIKNIQSDIIYLALIDKKYGSYLLGSSGKTSIFDKPHQLLWNIIIKYYTKYKKFPTLDILKYIVSNITSEEIKKLTSFVIENILNIQKIDKEFIINQTQSFVKEQLVKKAIIKSADILRENKEEKYDEIVKTIMDAMRSSDLLFDVGISYTEDLNSRLSQENVPRDGVVQTGFFMDNELSFGLQKGKGGVSAGELAIILGGTGKGKSTWLQNISKNAIMDGKRVVYISGELNESTLASRLDLSILKPIENMENIGIYSKEFIDNLKRELSKIRGKMFIKYFPPRKFSTLDIESYLDKLEGMKGIKPDLLIVDYIGLVKPLKKRNSRYEELEEIAEDLKGIGGYKNCAVWTAGQTHRGAREKESVDLNDIASSYAMSFVCDLVVSISGSSEEYADSSARLFINKNRNGKEGISFPLRMDLKNFHISDDNAVYQQENLSDIPF